jgi:outer membrane protein OmpA-like peptidoglycan-associated protein
MTIDEAADQYAQIGSLQEQLRAAGDVDADVLAPTRFAAASQKLDEAIDAARAGDSAQANSLASAGIQGLEKIDQDLERSRDLLREVLEARQRAEDAGGELIYPDRTAELEESLREVSELIETDELTAAKEQRQTLIDGYSKLELSALKEGVVEAAKASIDKAEKNDAKKLAPKTFGAAKDEMKLARSILDADRTETEKANVHAKRAKFLANQSAEIAELIKDMDRREFDREDTVVWYQSQLSTIFEPVGEKLRFDRSNRDVVLQMQKAYSTVLEQRAKGEETGDELLAKKLATDAERARFEEAQSMFTEAEGTVYRKLENVLLSLHGFNFPSGGSEITAENFVLLNKVTKVIELFPGSTIEVSGHTDATGGAELNLKLSKQRAANVVKFLIEVGGISPDRLSSQGYGDQRPVARNDTQEGRALNRRVEILIVNP